MTTSRDKSVLYPPFAEQLLQFEEKLAATALPFSLFCGLRTWQEQAALYDQGRGKPGAIVTKARAGHSWHNFGLAADYVGHQDNEWSWDWRVYDFKRMAEIAQTVGLEAGYFWESFQDPPHVQNIYGLTLSRARALYLIGGLERVWKECDHEKSVGMVAG